MPRYYRAGIVEDIISKVEGFASLFPPYGCGLEANARNSASFSANLLEFASRFVASSSRFQAYTARPVVSASRSPS
jgi:hypothetical protein